MARLATFWFWFAVAAIALLCLGQSFGQSQDVAVIVNPKNVIPASESISSSRLGLR